MLKIYKYGSSACNEFLQKLKTRSDNTESDVISSVTEIIKTVKRDKDKALFSYTEMFDNISLTKETVELSREKLIESASKVPNELYSAMERAAKNIRLYHEKQKRTSYIDLEQKGKITGQRIRAMKRAGIYVPGGSAAYPSSVLMNAIPAKIAGVEEIIMTTPVRDGGISPAVAAAAIIAGVDRVFMVGGAQAISAMAYGTESIPRVDIIAGPGNIYVATAKRLVYGDVNIDMVAGPSEVLIIADKTGNADYIAADLLAQAEHDPLSSSILLTDCENLCEKVSESLSKQLDKLDRKSIAEKSIENYGCAIFCPNLKQAAALADEIAPEHLEIMTQNPLSVFNDINNAGSVFLGDYSPEPLGDYFAGPNHVLPTNGTARFSSPLSVDNFIKKTSFLMYEKEGLKEYSDDIMRFASSEGLSAHAKSIGIRFDEE